MAHLSLFSRCLPRQSSVANVGPNAAFGSYRPIQHDAVPTHWGAAALPHHEEPLPLPPAFAGFQG